MSTFKQQIKEYKKMRGADKAQVILGALIKISLALALAVSLIELHWTNVFVSALTLIITLLPWYLERNYKFHIPIGFEFALVVFVYATLFLGEIHGFYTRFWWWDVVLHAGSAMAFGFIGFLILYSLYREDRLQTSPWLIAALSFSVALAIGGIWEIFEFTMDNIFGLNMQKSGLVDTMWDLIVDTTGAFIAAISGYLFLRRKHKGLGVFKYYVNSYFKTAQKKK